MLPSPWSSMLVVAVLVGVRLAQMSTMVEDEPDLYLPSWLTNDLILAQIATIFGRMTHIDFVLDDRSPDRVRQLDYIVQHLRNDSGFLRGKSIRIYQEQDGMDGVDSCATVLDHDYGDEFDLIHWDRTYDSFAKIWGQNQFNGYLVFANVFTFDRLVGCLLDPIGTYLIVMDDDMEPDEVGRLLTAIWNKDGSFQVFTLAGERLFGYDPFVRVGSRYGMLKELNVSDDLPRLPNVNFDGYPLRIEIFWSTYTIPMNTSRPNRDFIGPDAEVGRTVTKFLNFTAVFIPPDNDNFGTQLPNGSFNGVIGRLARRESDVAFVGFFVKDYFSRDIEFTSGVYGDELCCLVKKASRIPEYLLPITIFPSDLWGVLFLAGIIFSVIWVIIRGAIRITARVRNQRNQRQRLAELFNLSNETRDAPRYRKVIQICVDTYIIWVSAPYRRFTHSGVERLMLVGTMLVSVIFVSMFQSSLSSVFLNPVYYKDIDTLQQLDKSGMKIVVKYRGFMDDVFPANNTPTMDALRNKMAFEQYAGSMPGRVARIGTISTVTRKSTLSLDNAIYLSTNQLHMVRECPRMYNLAYVVSRHSVFLERINTMVMRMFDGGLVDRWISDMNYNFTIRDWEQIRATLGSNFKILTLVDMQFPFYLLAIGLCVSTVVFGAELVHHRIGRARGKSDGGISFSSSEGKLANNASSNNYSYTQY
ncbi:AAEL015647-PA [Aedes aegypti]|uniref:AAEL015647-PA n=1 Tax=Aedes aegypti TaxID=7159 RepID=Q1DGG1_AEDAE|nr:AAEL015647-PA [Aedes aegypti]